MEYPRSSGAARARIGAGLCLVAGNRAPRALEEFQRVRIQLPDSSEGADALNFNTIPVRIAATKTPVPAADSQLMENTAASALALGGATGGMRCTSPCREGICQVGSDKVPPRAEPSRVAWILTALKMPFR